MNKARLKADCRYNKDQVLTMRDKLRVSYTIKTLKEKAYQKTMSRLNEYGHKKRSASYLTQMVGEAVASRFVFPIILKNKIVKALYKRNINRV